MRNKKNDKKALSEEKTSDEIKTLKRTNRKKSFRRIYAFATLLVIIVILISIFVPMKDNMKQKASDPLQIVENNNGLPKIETFDKLYELVKENSERTEMYLKQAQILAVGAVDTENKISNELDNTETTETFIEENHKEVPETNIQIESVNEPDVVKTDGKYIYYIQDKKVTIIDARNVKKLKKIIDIKYDTENGENFIPSELYVYEDNLVVIGNKTLNGENINYVATKIYNIEKKNKPKLERELEIEGEYLLSRMNGENVYVLSNKYLYASNFNEKTINELNENDFKPTYLDTSVSEEIQYINFDKIYYLPESGDTSYLNILGFNITNSDSTNIESYFGAGKEVYASESNLYVTKVRYDIKDSKVHGFYNNIDINTYIYKFNLEDYKIKYETVGNVPGEVLDQFSMDENNEYFRIATTVVTNTTETKNSNNMYILDKDLNITGKVENLANGEKVYSVQFIDNRAYMETFVETNPLFVIELSNPTNPVVLGELKIPDYSKYLYLYDEKHIIGFCEDTKIIDNETENLITTDGMKMAVFDVTDPNEPKEMFSEKIGEQGTYSEILNNHRTLLCAKDKNIIAFPINITNEENKLEFQGAIAYGFDLESGFSLKGKIAHFDINKKAYKYEKTVNRIIYIDNSIITLSEELAKSTNLENMKEQSKLEI